MSTAESAIDPHDFVDTFWSDFRNYLVEKASQLQPLDRSIQQAGQSDFSVGWERCTVNELPDIYLSGLLCSEGTAIAVFLELNGDAKVYFPKLKNYLFKYQSNFEGEFSSREWKNQNFGSVIYIIKWLNGKNSVDMEDLFHWLHTTLEKLDALLRNYIKELDIF